MKRARTAGHKSAVRAQMLPPNRLSPTHKSPQAQNENRPTRAQKPLALDANEIKEDATRSIERRNIQTEHFRFFSSNISFASRSFSRVCPLSHALKSIRERRKRDPKARNQNKIVLDDQRPIANVLRLVRRDAQKVRNTRTLYSQFLKTFADGIVYYVVCIFTRTMRKRDVFFVSRWLLRGFLVFLFHAPKIAK